MVFVLVFFVTFSTSVFAQDNSDAMKTWMEYMTPGKVHEKMASMAGEWVEHYKFWMAPDTEPQISEGSASFEMILGGRYMQGKHKGEMMGQPFEGINLESFDNGKKEYTSIWIDNMGTGVAVSHGTMDEKTKVLNMSGIMYEPTQGKDISFRTEILWDGNDKMINKMFTTVKGKEFMSMEITMTRKK